MEDALPTDLIVSAQIRTAAREGVSIVVRRRGDNSSGSILLKINRLDGTSHVLSQVRDDTELVWNPVSATDTLPEAEAERYIDEQIRFDPDLWVVEVEDKQGRPWFSGRIIKTP